MTAKPKGVVAAGHETTAGAAAEMLRDGGNAFDAALAGLFASCVPEVVLSSLGGGGCLMAHVGERNETVLYDFFVDTPGRRLAKGEADFRSVHVDFGPASQEFHVGAGASAVPGIVPGAFRVHKDLCSLPMTRIVEPAVRAAREGVEMNAFHGYLFSIVEPILTPDAKQAVFCGPDGVLLKAGERLRNENLGDTLETLAVEGPQLFVDGEIGDVIVAQMEALGGHLTREDLAAYKVLARAPLNWDYRGHAVSLNPAPALSGPLIAFGFALLERLGDGEPVAADVLARVMAATNDVRRDNASGLRAITDAKVIEAQLAAISGHAPAPRGTTHISVIDGAGNAAAVTVSNGEGNGIVVGDCGFMLNNMLGEEDLNPDGFDTWVPGTRMSTMMAPTLLHGPDGSLSAMGSGGSNRIRSAVLQVVLNLVDRGMSLVDAVSAARLHVEKCGTLSFEDRFAPGARAALMAAFPDAHAWPEPSMFFGGVHAARRNGDGTFEAAGDPRRAGVALVVV